MPKKSMQFASIEIENNMYPKLLKEIANPPQKLYINGNKQILNTNCISVIGSRKCTEYGEKWCEYFVKELVKYNITIVSGMAIGIDSIAHKSALKYGGRTIAVLPSGLNNIFPQENQNLYNQIIQNGGAVITEYSKEKKANSKKLLERNRIVSGLSFATLVIEGAYRSGTSVTAKLAKKQERDVFCIPRRS